MQPLVFLDVDGPLIPFGAPDGYPAYTSVREGNPLLVRIDPALGPRLAALPGELVWATTWVDVANEVVAPLLGLPPLPVVTWADGSIDEGLHWKTRQLCTWADGRPFAWIDDEITDVDQAWVTKHYRGAALLHRIDARVGLTNADFESVTTWLTASR
jgi:hypothetical protein